MATTALLAVLLGLLLLAGAVYAQGNYSLFLPLAMQDLSPGEPGQPTETPTATPTVTPTTTPGGDGQGAFFVSPNNVDTRLADVAVDSDGGHHVVFLGWEGITSVKPPKPAWYGYCPPGVDCATPGNWQVLGMTLPANPDANQWSDIELAVGPGRVAFIAYADTWPAQQPRTLVYAECSSGCTDDVANWRAFAALQDPENTNFTGRVFALDPGGNPRFVYHEWSSDGTGTKLHFASCDAADCSSAANWQDLTIAPDPEFVDFEHEYLAYTADGKARLVSTYSSTSESPGFTY